jgi:hypothetical protein
MFFVLMMEYIEECMSHLRMLRFCGTEAIESHLTGSSFVH